MKSLSKSSHDNVPFLYILLPLLIYTKYKCTNKVVEEVLFNRKFQTEAKLYELKSFLICIFFSLCSTEAYAELFTLPLPDLPEERHTPYLNCLQSFNRM